MKSVCGHMAVEVSDVRKGPTARGRGMAGARTGRDARGGIQSSQRDVSTFAIFDPPMNGWAIVTRSLRDEPSRMVRSVVRDCFARAVGTDENCPAINRWVAMPKEVEVPQGRMKSGGRRCKHAASNSHLLMANSIAGKK